MVAFELCQLMLDCFIILQYSMGIKLNIEFSSLHLFPASLQRWKSVVNRLGLMVVGQFTDCKT